MRSSVAGQDTGCTRKSASGQDASRCTCAHCHHARLSAATTHWCRAKYVAIMYRSHRACYKGLNVQCLSSFVFINQERLFIGVVSAAFGEPSKCVLPNLAPPHCATPSLVPLPGNLSRYMPLFICDHECGLLGLWTERRDWCGMVVRKSELS